MKDNSQRRPDGSTYQALSVHDKSSARQMHNSRRSKRHRMSRKTASDVTLLVSTFIIHFLTVGFSVSIGVYYMVFLDVFASGSGLTAWISSINYAALCSTGPVASWVLQKIGCSRTILLGGVISTLGLFTSVLTNQIYMMFISLGLVAGSGFGLCFTSAITLISCSFDKWRVTSVGISLAGASLGTIVQPILVSYLIAEYGWKGSLLIESAIHMHICLAGMFIWVVESRDEKSKAKAKKESNARGNIKDKKRNNNVLSILDKEKCESKHSIVETVEYTSREKSMWLNFMYWVMHFNVFLFCFGQSVVYTHIAAFAENIGFSAMKCSSFISVLGIANLLGRVLLALFTQHPCINVTLLYSFCYILAGVSAVGYTMWSDYTFMCVQIFLVGFAIAAFGPLLSEVVMNTVGVKHFPKAYGFLMLSMGGGTLLGAPCAGWLYDYTTVYNNSFYLSGVTLAISGLVVLLPAIAEKLQNFYCFPANRKPNLETVVVDRVVDKC